MSTNLDYRVETKTITDLRNLYEDGLLNLEPGFQRQSVWSERDRAKLIDSILRNYPLPAIFLYRRHEDGQIVYDVIDGKQRIEAILRFIGDMRGSYWVRTQLPGEAEAEWLNWKKLEKKRSQHLLSGFRLPVVEVNGDLGDISSFSSGSIQRAKHSRHRRSDAPSITTARFSRRPTGLPADGKTTSQTWALSVRDKQAG